MFFFLNWAPVAAGCQEGICWSSRICLHSSPVNFTVCKLSSLQLPSNSNLERREERGEQQEIKLARSYPVLQPINICGSGELEQAPPGNIFTTLQLLLSCRQLYRIELGVGRLENWISHTQLLKTNKDIK